ncbi:Beta-ureidopropionase, partial [Halocaridina rubra]
MSGELASIEQCLEKHIPEEQLKEVRRILYGRELGTFTIIEAVENLAEQHNFEVKGYCIPAAKEELAPP